MELRLKYDKLVAGPIASLEVKTAKAFTSSTGLSTLRSMYCSSMNLHAPMLVSNNSEVDVFVKKGTLVANATLEHVPTEADASALGMMNISIHDTLALRVIENRFASGLEWKCLGTEAPGSLVKFSDGERFVVSGSELRCKALATVLGTKGDKDVITLTRDEWQEVRPKELLRSHVILADNGCYYSPTTELPYEEGGRPTMIEHLHDLGFTLEKSIDPDGEKGPNGEYPPLPDAKKQRLYAIALKWSHVWSRDARTPALSRLVVLDIPTGDSAPVAQKPYPLPYAYLDAVRKEVQKLLDGGLIEPCISNWASPVLVRLKKDSTPQEVRLKLIVDYRRLNEVTVPDVAGLGDQEEILDGFGGDQRFCGIADAAGGFYQYLIAPQVRHKTSFCLPTSMGGTTFQWRVAPYGLSRNPAGYSRGMMYALKGLDNCQLRGPGTAISTGGSKSWIDDITMHADSFEGFEDLFEQVLMRMAFASMSLKASKCYLLHQKLEVLGFHVTPDGIVMQQDKLDNLGNRDREGNLVAPRNEREIRTFLGAVQFYRRFVPRLAMLAAPMNDMLKKHKYGDPVTIPGTPEWKKAWKAVEHSFECILMFLKSSAVVSAPDLSDPLAEYVVCTDACDVAAGGVLLQWQWPGKGPGPGPPEGTPLRGGKGPDPLTQSWRLKAGWKLRTIAFYSKTFDTAQRNYATFDKEAAAILLCCRKWAKLITCHPTTLYTDSVVAASMLTKHLGPARLQRWGMELGTFLPYLKIQYRKGVENGMADFLSRYPTFSKYYATKEDVAYLPDDLFEDLQEIPLFTHQLGPDEDALLRGWRYTIAEAKKPQEIGTLWQSQFPQDDATGVTHDEDTAQIAAVIASPAVKALPSIAAGMSKAVTLDELPDRIMALKAHVTQHQFWREQEDFEKVAEHWDQYVSAFTMTHGHAPVLYDLYCGEGGYSRGARASGCECYGFDNKPSCRQQYEHEPGVDGKQPSCMTFIEADVNSAEFWLELCKPDGRYSHLPLPDIIHASPPCIDFTRVTNMGKPDTSATDTGSIDALIRRLRELETRVRASSSRPLIWQVENVPESEAFVTEPVTAKARLCGTMMGHRVFRHRTFYCNYTADDDLPHDHAGKLVGSRGVTGSHEQNERRFGHLPAPNMYGVYSRPYHARGTIDEWHGAIGSLPGTYTGRGIANALPLGYGRYLTSQMVAHAMSRTYHMPVWTPKDIACDDTQKAALRLWSERGYQVISRLNSIEDIEPDLTPPLRLLSFDEDTSEWLRPVFDNMPEPMAEDETVDSPYVITREDQMRDPMWKPLMLKLEAAERKPAEGEADATTAEALSTVAPRVKRGKQAPKTLVTSLYRLSGGLLYRIRYSGLDGGPELKLCVPEHLRTKLMAQYHYVHHRGPRQLESQLRQSYDWPGMSTDCLDFVRTCSVCQPVSSRPMQRAVTNPIPTPSRPFSVIHVDHKGPLPTRRSGEFNHILVVVCALTRYTLLLPVKTTSAEETLKALIGRVFCVFGNPSVVVSDNGPAFISHLNAATAKFFGYRHIHILPYNAQANGTAESAVKRVKLLLDRQTNGYSEWHKLLPLMQLMLNSTVMTTTGMTPFAALFGREPDGLERLENPALYPDGDGHEFLRELKGRLKHLHEELRACSDAVKEARAQEENAREHARLDTSKFGQVLPSTPTVNRYVWMIHGSKEQATYLRKHGHGTPWRYKYKVLEVRPHAVRLEVPKDGSVPRVNEWQLIRRVAPAHEFEHSPGEDAPELTECGIPVPHMVPNAPRATPDGDLEDADDDRVHDIDHVSHAEKVGNVFKIYIKWRNHDEVTFRYRHELVNETNNPELLQEIEDAVQEERARLRAQRGQAAADAEMEDMPPQDAPAASNEQQDEPQLGRGQRVRTRAQFYQPAFMVSTDETTSPLISFENAIKAILFVDFDIPLLD